MNTNISLRAEVGEKEDDGRLPSSKLLAIGPKHVETHHAENGYCRFQCFGLASRDILMGLFA